MAENIKLAYGACLPSKVQSINEKILQINDEETNSYEQLSINYLAKIITCRIREIIDAVLYNIQESGYADRLRSGVVLTGNGANLPNLPVVFRELSGYKVRIGVPRRQSFSAFGCPIIFETGSGTAIGMILEAKRDPRLNCAEDLETNIKEDTPTPIIETDPAPEELFPEPPSEGGVIVPPEPGNNKPDDGKVVKWINRQAKRAEIAAKKAFEKSLGTLFDGMGKDENNSQ